MAAWPALNAIRTCARPYELVVDRGQLDLGNAAALVDLGEHTQWLDRDQPHRARARQFEATFPDGLVGNEISNCVLGDKVSYGRHA